MINYLAEILDDFPGGANQTRCFAHTLSISAKAILKQFDVPKANTGEEEGALCWSAASEINTGKGTLKATLTQHMLTNEQLRKFSYAVKNSSTILLPEWYQTLTSQNLAHRIMPRDVSTRWNSTYDMLEFAVNYRGAIDTMAAHHDLNLWKYELEPVEWKIAKELRDVLKVCVLFYFNCVSNELYRSTRTRLSSFREEPQTLPQSYWLWTTSTKSFLHYLIAPTSSHFRSVLLWPLGKRR
jgi:hypothetical protein